MTTARNNAGRADAAVRSGVDGAAEHINRLLTTFAGLVLMQWREWGILWGHLTRSKT